MTAVQRCLDNMELVYWTERPGRYTNSEITFEYKGELNLSALKKSAHLLYRRYPALRANIIKNDKCDTGYSFVLPETDNLDFRIASQGLDEINEITKRRAEEAIKDRERQALFNVIVYCGQNCGIITVGFHHAIVTGNTMGQYIADLFHIYNGIVSGRDIEIDPQPFPKPSESFGVNAELRGSRKVQLNSPDRKKLEVPLKKIGHSCKIKLNKEETSALLSAKREIGVDFRSLIGSCAAIALRNHYDSDIIDFHTTIDWTRRNNLKYTAATTAVSSHILKFHVTPAANSMQLSKEIYEKVMSIKNPSDNEKALHEEVDGPDIALNNGGDFLSLMPVVKGLDLNYNVDEATSQEKALLTRDSKTDKERFEASFGPAPSRPKFGIIALTVYGELRLNCRIREDINAEVVDDFMDHLHQLHRGRRDTIHSIVDIQRLSKVVDQRV